MCIDRMDQAMLHIAPPSIPQGRRLGRSLRLALPLVAFILSFLPTLTEGADAAFERIRQSLPQKEEGWTVVEADGPHRHNDGSQQASFVWSMGADEVSAMVILHKNMKTARGEFRHPGEEASHMNNFFVDGIGDEAYLFPPVILNQAGPFNLFFRKGRYAIRMSAGSKETILRCARYIADSIAGRRSKRDEP